MRIGLIFDGDSRPQAVQAREKFQGQPYDVVCVGCAQNLVDKLAAGDRFDMLVDCCQADSINSRTVQALAELYGLQTTSVQELLKNNNIEARRPHMLEMAGSTVKS